MSKSPVKSNMAPLIEVEDMRFIPLVSTAMYLIAFVLAYVIAIGLDHVEPIFPFISHVVAYPPQTGLGVIFGTPAALLGILALFLRYAVIDQRERAIKSENGDSIKRLNKAALIGGIVSYVSISVVLLNPIGFPSQEIFDMVMTTGVPHHLGDFGALICFTAYVFIELCLSYSQRSVYKANVFLQFVLVLGATIGIIGILVTIYPALTEIFHTLEDKRTGTVQLIYKKYSFTAATCAVSEWLFIAMCLFFVATFYRDLENVKMKFYLKSNQHKL